MKKRRYLSTGTAAVLLLALALVASLVNGGQPAAAESQFPQQIDWGQGTCFADTCSKSSPCSAGDTAVSSVSTLEVIEPCTYVGDTGIYTFLAEFQSNATGRYDPAAWIATDGGDARNGSCFSTYLDGTLQPTNTPPFPPYWDDEKNGDTCGDISSAYKVTKTVGPVTINCTATNTAGTINTCSAYDNNVSNNCPGNNGCPDVGSKCNCKSVPFEVNLKQVDLACTKTASVSTIPTSGEFNYQIAVSNVQYTTPCFQSSGYKVTDNLPVWLKANGTLPTGCSAAPDPSEKCFDDVGGCQGYGDIVTCNITANLACPATASPITLNVAIWKGTPPVGTDDPRYNATATPNNLGNTAGVAGFEVDPVSGNNSCSTSVATAVELKSFTATAAKKAIVLTWETISEVDNLGFNLYRAEAVDGERTQLNADLIPANPGGQNGAVYSFTDETVKIKRTYYYWLEDVDMYGSAELHGPVEATAVQWSLIKLPPIKGPVDK